jgi:hypothetical protein
MPPYANAFDREFAALNSIAAEDTTLVGMASEDIEWQQHNGNGDYPTSNPKKKNNGE